MRDKIELQNTILMYKKDRITKYVLEREIAAFMGDKVHVKVDCNRNVVGKTYCINVFPERQSDGFHLTLIIDENAIKGLFTEEEFVKILEKLYEQNQKILQKYNSFSIETAQTEVSMSMALGFILDLYLDYRNCFLGFGKDTVLTDENELRNLTDKFNLETADTSDKERLVLDGFISELGIEMCKKYIHTMDGIKIHFADDNEQETPDVDFWNNRMEELSTSTIGVRDHKEIPDDYLPKTNQ